MPSRRLALFAATASALATTLLVTSPATAGGDVTDYTVTDDSGDAPAAIDIVKVRVYPTTGDYRATLTYRDLKPQSSTRWVISLADYNENRRGTGGVESTGNAVELRITPAGKVKTKAFTLYSDDSYEPSTCPGIAATPNWNLNKIKIVIPEICWNLSTGTAFVAALTRTFTPAEGWSTDFYDMGEGSKRDNRFFTWNWVPF